MLTMGSACFNFPTLYQLLEVGLLNHAHQIVCPCDPLNILFHVDAVGLTTESVLPSAQFGGMYGINYLIYSSVG